MNINSFKSHLNTSYLISLTVFLGLVIYGLFFSNADWVLFRDQFFNFEKMEGRYHIFVPPLILVLKISLYSCFWATTIGLVMAIIRNYDNM